MRVRRRAAYRVAWGSRRHGVLYDLSRRTPPAVSYSSAAAFTSPVQGTQVSGYVLLLCGRCFVHCSEPRAELEQQQQQLAGNAQRARPRQSRDEPLSSTRLPAPLGMLRRRSHWCFVTRHAAHFVPAQQQESGDVHYQHLLTFPPVLLPHLGWPQRWQPQCMSVSPRLAK